MKRFVIANWKNYVTPAASVKFFDQIVAWMKKEKPDPSVTVILAPSPVALPLIAARLARTHTRTRIMLAAQDVGFAPEGAFTGATSPRDIKLIGAHATLIGHSERRQWFGEDDSLVRKKTVAALHAGLFVVLCVGETKDERQSGRAHDVVRAQLRAVLGDAVVKKNLSRLIIAYEPRFAIGTGIPITPDEAQDMHTLIAREVGERVPILYGGSVVPGNAKSFLTCAHTAGVLVGGASTKFSSLTALIRVAATVTTHTI